MTDSTREGAEAEGLRRSLDDSQEEFRLLVQSVTDYAIFKLDPEGNVATWNAGAQRIKGYTAEEIIGKHFSIFYPPEVAASGHPQHELEFKVGTQVSTTNGHENFVTRLLDQIVHPEKA